MIIIGFVSDEIYRCELTPGMGQVREIIQACQKAGHEQQVAYSTYHDRLTQICFTEKLIIYNTNNEVVS